MKVDEDLRGAKGMREKVRGVIKEMENRRKEEMNLTDKDSVWVREDGRVIAGYNGQVVTDEENGIVVHSDVVAQSNDQRQVYEQIRKADESVGSNCEVAVMDGGYESVKEIEKIEETGIEVIMPIGGKEEIEELEDREENEFRYDKETDSYICREDKRLVLKWKNPRYDYDVYQIEEKGICLKCQYYGECARDKRGRRKKKKKKEYIRQRVRQRYKSELGQELYKKRKWKVEGFWGYVKRDRGMREFFQRGLEGVKTELSLIALSFNLKRMIKLMGVKKLIAKLT